MRKSDKQTLNKRRAGDFAPGNKIGNRFAPGVSGNPNGRPRLTSLTDALREQLAEILPHADERTTAEHLARSLIRQALKGNVAALSLIADRTEGKPKQSLDVDLNVKDWRAAARQYGLNLDDVRREAEYLLSESADALSGSESN